MFIRADLFADLPLPPHRLQQGANFILSAWTQSRIRHLDWKKVCVISAKRHVFWTASLRQRVSKASVIGKEFCRALDDGKWPWVLTRKQTLLRSSASGHDDPQSCAQKLLLGKFIGCQKTNFLCCETRLKAVLCVRESWLKFQSIYG